ncbi:MAG: hydroxymethylglutaryl-CoA lyase [Desulfuromonadales bacterium]|nr:hydroxymethylglutaryl-CoA lyase [Desulfuromonadales bacterium]MBN2792536.1 hydroxymethylglutaryl-CoA lyase [Desulfuromonadales bacterium]
MNNIDANITIVEVAPRDGFQSIKPFIPTKIKLKAIDLLYKAGCGRMEIGAFVSPKALPQMADIKEIFKEMDPRKKQGAAALVPNFKGGDLAISSGLQNVVYVISASESHNKSNVNRSIDESFEDFRIILSNIDSNQVAVRFDLSTCFHCPFEGLISESRILQLVERALKLNPHLEIGICDTTGRAMPDHIARLFTLLFQKIDPNPRRWAFHGHDTYGLGVTNNLNAYYSGVRIFDAATAGLGGCPYAPGARGNTATEDLVYLFENMGITTGLELEPLLDAADFIAQLAPSVAGGRIRTLPRNLIVA